MMTFEWKRSHLTAASLLRKLCIKKFRALTHKLPLHGMSKSGTLCGSLLL